MAIFVLRIDANRSVSGWRFSKYRALCWRTIVRRQPDYAPPREHCFVLSSRSEQEMFLRARPASRARPSSFHGCLNHLPLLSGKFYDASLSEEIIHLTRYRYGQAGGMAMRLYYIRLPRARHVACRKPVMMMWRSRRLDLLASGLATLTAG